jgi:hypothetical protein
MRAGEIAAALGVAEGTVHAHLHAARGKLIAGLAPYYPFGQDGANQGRTNRGGMNGGGANHDGGSRGNGQGAAS